MDNVAVPLEGWAWGLDFGLWGKSDGLPVGVVYPLVGHLLDAAGVAYRLWDLHLTEPQRRTVVSGLGLDPDAGDGHVRARGLLACWAGWHDLGKITQSFQVKDKTARARLSGYTERIAEGPRVTHGWATHLALAGMLPDRGYDAAGDGLAATSPARRVAQLLGGHHGRFFAQPLRRELRHASLRQRSLGAGKWEEQRVAHVTAVAAVVGEPAAPAALSVGAAVLVAEVVVLADWLASQKRHVVGQLAAVETRGELEVREHWARALAAAPVLIAEAGLGVPEWKDTPLV